VKCKNGVVLQTGGNFLCELCISLCVFIVFVFLGRAHGGAVGWGRAPRPEGRGIDPRLCHWNFPLTYFFRPHYYPGVASASNRNEYQEYFLGVKAAGA